MANMCMASRLKTPICHIVPVSRAYVGGGSQAYELIISDMSKCKSSESCISRQSVKTIQLVEVHLLSVFIHSVPGPKKRTFGNLLRNPFASETVLYFRKAQSDPLLSHESAHENAHGCVHQDP